MHKSRLQILEMARAVLKSKGKPKGKSDFQKKFEKVYMKGPPVRSSWHLTGHAAGTFGISPEVQKMKEKVFGKRTMGTSDLLFMHKHHGIVTHPAVGEITHADVEYGEDYDTKRRGVQINHEIRKKVVDGGKENIIGIGRIEHHEGGGGIISYNHQGQGSVSAAVRSIARAYPKYTIHDGHGIVLEQKEENLSRKHIREVIHRLMEAKR